MFSEEIILPDKIFVTGIGTEVGKTYVSAYLCRTLDYDYWKPIQSGDLDQSDSSFIHKHAPDCVIYEEKYRLQTPMSPHASAEIDGIEIKVDGFKLPDADRLLVEGAGGLMVPINDSELMIDLCLKFGLPVVVVIRDYLGCINHTILTLEVLKKSGLACCCLVFNGLFVRSTVEYLSQKYQEIPQLFVMENALEQ